MQKTAAARPVILPVGDGRATCSVLMTAYIDIVQRWS